MVDYYPILARAVSRLGANNAQARQKLYGQARTCLLVCLENDPQRSMLETLSERIAFETAIFKVEANSQCIREKITLKSRLEALHELQGKKPTSENGTPGLVPDVASLLRKLVHLSRAPTREAMGPIDRKATGAYLSLDPQDAP